jgi:uncharacterized protein (UPF0333 family)
MEYLLVVGFSMMFLVAIIVVAYSQSSTFAYSVSDSQIKRVGATIVDSVDGVYAAGPPSKKTIKLYFPQNIQQVSIQNNSLVFLMSGESGPYEYAISATTNMTGSIRPFAGLHKITIVVLDQPGSPVNVTDS